MTCFGRAAIVSSSVLIAISCATDPNYGPTTGTKGRRAAVRHRAAGVVQVDIARSADHAKQDATYPIVSVKYPTVVQVDGRWHVFATTANTAGAWSIVYLTFTDWAQADAAPLHYLDNNPPGLGGYHAAPQVFYFAPQNKWYLVFQSGQPQYSTNDDITKPEAGAGPQLLRRRTARRHREQGQRVLARLLVICDDANCHLFFADDDGELFRSQTKVGDFPGRLRRRGRRDPGRQGDRVRGRHDLSHQGQGRVPDGGRGLRPDGQPLLSIVRVSDAGRRLDAAGGGPGRTRSPARRTSRSTDGVVWTCGHQSRRAHPQRLRPVGWRSIPTNLQLLYQGADPASTSLEYSQIPWKISLLSQVTP